MQTRCTRIFSILYSEIWLTFLVAQLRIFRQVGVDFSLSFIEVGGRVDFFGVAGEAVVGVYVVVKFALIFEWGKVFE